MSYKFVSVNVWKKDSGSLLSHRDGLTQEQIDEFKSLKPGDRLMLSPSNREGDSAPAGYIRIYRKEKPVRTQEDI